MPHQKQSRARHARMAHAQDTPDERDLFDRAMLPRFSPTAIYPNGPTETSASAAGSSSAAPAPAQPTTSAAAPTSTSAPAPVTSSSSSPAPVVAPTTTSTSSSTSAAPTSTSTSTSSSSSTSASSSSPSSSSALLATSTAVVPLSSSTAVALSSSTIPPTTALLTTASPVLASLTTTIGGSSATPSATSTTAPSGGTSTSLVVGGIAGGLVGVAGLIFVVMFIIRRYRKSGDDEDSPFDADNFRRQSAILIDDDQASMRGRGGARPPTMIERHMQNANTFDAPPMPSLQQYHQYNDMPGPGMAGAGVNAYEGNGYGGEYDRGYPSPAPGGLTRQPSFSPGQIVSPTSPPPVHGGGYGDMSRQPSMDPYGQPMQTGYADLARQPSNAGYPDMSRQNSMQQGLGAPQHYGDGDLDRSSVTPFQAQQYAEIHQRLNLDPAAPLNAVNEDEEPGSGRHSDTFHDQPYDEPEPFDPRGTGQSIDGELPNPFGDSEIVPPSPVYSMNPKASPAVNASRDRIVSGPPTIPELARAFSPIGPSSYDFPQTPQAGGWPTPSPLNSGFAIPPAAAPAPRLTEKTNAQRPMSTHTVYDEEDAYGGM